MDPDLEWIVTKVDGQISAISNDYSHFANVAKSITALPVKSVREVITYKIKTADLIELAARTRREDLRLFGSAFQKEVWNKLFDLTHGDVPPRLYSYSEFAQMCNNLPGVRSVAHAVACNPIAYIIPCHLIVPKKSIDKIAEIQQNAQTTIFKGRDLYLLDSIDVGEYEYGKKLKKMLIAAQLGQ
jgi:O-6-methylguanine DNA methyltransferase